MSPRTYRVLVIATEIAVPILILAAWQLWTVSADDPKFPRLTTILAEFQDLWLFSEFGTHVLPSLKRIALGFCIAVIIGVGLGIPIGLSRWARLWTMPHIEYWRAMPPPALLPISIVLLGIFDKQKVALIAFFCLFPILLNAIDGVRGIEPTLMETARSYGIPWRETVRRIVVPAAMPQIVAGMRTSLSLAVIIMVLAEWWSSTSGVGYVLLISKDTLQFTTMWAAILLIGLLGYALNLLFGFFEKRLLAWHRGWRARHAAIGSSMLEIKRLGKTYGFGEKATHAIGDVSFAVADGEFVCVVGPSGCGKTTLLKCIAGLLQPSQGEIALRGRIVTSPPEEMALVFQEYNRSLFPWMTVRNNVQLPLRHKSLKRDERRRLVDEALEEVGLTRFVDHYPWQLSGGMQQRVAIARALAYQPSILLMDEPFASVDAQTRDDLEDLVLQVHKDYGVTILFVTHDIDESVYLADRIVVLTHAPTEVKEVVPGRARGTAGPDRDEGAARVCPAAHARVPADQARAGRRVGTHAGACRAVVR